ncbi:GntR family transcriptional regulator [Sciscionella marina]|uniref:GntR family transcriptional regulator n=1 Tax=Sciscionella marina TaxID=508770 RepID=UPI00037E6CE2|nr:GntR family transcriptional regulator [Sciscionella marina]
MGKQTAHHSSETAFVRPKTAQQAVFEALRHEITTGERSPGSVIVQDAVAEKFNVSRIPIREALKRLEAEEYVSYAPHMGYRVTKLTVDELAEVFHLRDVLEAELIRDAMPKVTGEDITQMREAMAEMDEAAKDADLIALGVANRRFHELTFARSSMERTKRIVAQLWNTADAYRPLYAELMDMSKVNTEHVLITEAMAERDTDRVIALNHEHRKRSIDHIREALAE